MNLGINEKLWLLKVSTKKDPEAFGKLYDAYIEKIYRFVYFKVSSREEAEDITSETFLKAWGYLIENGNSKEVKNFAGFIYRVARNLIIDFYRKRGARQEVNLDPEMEIAIDDKRFNQVAVNQELEKVLKTLKKLKQEYQEIVLLKYVEEMSVGEIAEILGKSNLNVRVTLHRAGKKLKELYGEKS